jgi:UDP-galactopyranose mutase
MKRVAVVGAGFSGAVIAHELARAGYSIDVFEMRTHVAGNCHTARDEETGVMVHVYGPHIFHTSNRRVWEYVNGFDEFGFFVNRVKAISGGRVYSLPINLMTINAFFGRAFNPAEARRFIESLSDQSILDPMTFEEQALRHVGRELYEAFFKFYTLKQWGVEPRSLPSSILKRLPVRFNYDDNYYSSLYQGIPKRGYSYIVQRMLDQAGVTLALGQRFVREQKSDYDHVFYSGALDDWFKADEGRLAYRTLDFEIERHGGDFQGNPVINYCDASVPWTRISEHKHFAPWESHERTVIYKEYSRSCENGDVPYYPVRLAGDKALLARYVCRAHEEEGVTFVGRLGTYRYLDMHVTIAEALDVAAAYIRADSSGDRMPAFLVDPLM